MFNQCKFGFPLLITLIFTLTACGGSGDGDEDPSGDGSYVGGGDSNATGGFDLSGDDTAVYGTYLEAGAVGAALADSATGQPDYIIIVDEGKTVTDSMLFEFDDAEEALDGFVMVVSDASTETSDLKFISMTILKDGVEFLYACSTPVTTSGDCGGLDSIELDILSGTVTLNDTTVFNQDSGTVLTLDGTVTWN